MGQIWLVEDGGGERLALKQATALDQRSMLAFRQEYRVMTRLAHPNCCRAHDFGFMPDGGPFYTMELVEGANLDPHSPLPAAGAKAMLIQLARALGHVHRQGFVHRDVKPENVRVRPDGSLVLMDYGLMTYVGHAEAIVSGTLGYMAPEVIQRAPVDQRADLYAAGVLTFELVQGRLPFPYAQPRQVMQAHLQEPPPALQSGDPHLDAVVARLLAKDPAARYASTDELLVDLGQAGEAANDAVLLAPPLLGRERELARLELLYGAFREARAQATVVLEGPAGQGKSRLLEAFHARLQPEPVATAAGATREQAPPYAAARELLRGWLPFWREHTPDLLAIQAPVLAALLPELDVAPAGSLGSPEKEKLRLHAAIARQIIALAEVMPVVGLIEDWQWADPLSQDLLAFVLRTTREQPLLLVLTTRVLPEADWLPGAEVLGLPALAPEAVDAMVRAMLGSDEVAPAFLASIGRLAGGNPFYVERLLEHLVSRQVLVKQGGRWDTAVSFDAAEIPGDVAGLLIQQLAGLSADAARLARVAAVVARPFDYALVQALTGLGDEQLVEATDELLRQHVLVQERPGVFGFGHMIYRDALYQRLDPRERTDIHARLAGLLSLGVQPATAPFELVSAIADHGLAGGVPEAVATFGLEAGQRNAALFALAEAERQLTPALALWRGRGDDGQTLLALRALADTLRLAGRPADALALYQEALPLAEEAGRSDLSTRLLTAEAEAFMVLGRVDEALAACRRSIGVAREHDDQPAAVRGFLASGQLQFGIGNLGGAVADTERALVLAREAGDRASAAEAEAFLGHLYIASLPDKTDEGLAMLHAAIDALSAMGHRMGLQQAQALLGVSCLRLGDLAEAREAFARARQLAFELDLGREEALALVQQAWTAFALGDLSDSLAYARRALTLSGRLGHVGLSALAITAQARALAMRGYPAEGSALLAGLREAAAGPLTATLRERQIGLLTLLGRTAEAREAGEELYDLLLDSGNTEPIPYLHGLLGEAAARMGDFDAALRHVRRARADAEGEPGRGLQLQLLKVQAVVAYGREAYDEARGHVEQALALAEETNARTQAAELQQLAGEIALATGRGTDALAAFGQLIGLATAMGCPIGQALGYFGQAAAQPYGPEAGARVEHARALVADLERDLTPEAAAAYWSWPARARLREGNHIAFSIKRVQTAGTGPLENPKFGRGMI